MRKISKSLSICLYLIASVLTLATIGKVEAITLPISTVKPVIYEAKSMNYEVHPEPDKEGQLEELSWISERSEESIELAASCHWFAFIYDTGSPGPICAQLARDSGYPSYYTSYDGHRVFNNGVAHAGYDCYMCN